MAKLSNYRRLYSQDFSSEQQELIEQLGISINSAFDEIYNALDNRLTVKENLSATITEFNVAVNASGVPLNKTQFKLDNNQPNVEGFIVLNVSGVKDNTLLPTGGVFVSYVRNDNYIIINNIKGLEPSASYKIKALVLG